MIINEGVKVRFGADISQLLSGANLSKKAILGFGIAATTAMAGVITQSIRMSARLDKDIRLVATLGGEAAKSMGRLRHEVRELGKQFGQDFGAIASANYQAVSGGFKGISDSMRVTRAGTRLAVAGNADIVKSTEAVVKALNAFKEDSGKAEKASAQLWAMTRDGIVTVEQLGRFLQDLPASAAATGIKFHELGAAMSTITAVTGHASSAVDQIRSAIIKLEQNGITGTLLERVERFAGQGLGEIAEAVGDQTAARGILLLAQNAGLFKDNIAAALNVTDDFNTAVETMQGSTLTLGAQLKQNLNDVLGKLGDKILPTVNEQLALMNALLTPVAGKYPEGLQYLGPEDVPPGGLPVTSGPGPEPAVVVPFTPDRGGFHRRPGTIGIGPGAMPAFQMGRDPWTGRERREAWLDAIKGTTAPNPFFPGLSGKGGIDTSKINRAAREFDAASALVSGSVYTLAGSLSGALTGALISTNSAVGQLVSGLLSVIAQVGARALLSSFGIGFAHGGYTGTSGGVVHAGEYVFNAQAVKALGLGNLERAHQVANSYTVNATINQTVNGGDPSRVAAITSEAVGEAVRNLRISGGDRFYRKAGR